jgi:protein Mpv17
MMMQKATALRPRKSGMMSVRGLNCLSFLPKAPQFITPLFSSSIGDDGSNLIPPTPPITNGDSLPGEDDNDNNDISKSSINPLSSAALFLSKLLDGYNNLLEKHTMPTKMMTGGIIQAFGDMAAQLMEKNSKGEVKDFDWRRLFIFVLVGGVYFSPIISVWFDFLNSIPLPENKAIKAGIQLILDQTAGAFFVIGGFFFFFELLQHIIPPSTKKDGDNTIESIFNNGVYQVKNTLPSTLVANWKFWPFVNFLNFRYVPIQYRLLVSNAAALLWGIILSKITNAAH